MNAKQTFADLVNGIYADVTMFYTLWDEGLLDENYEPKEGIGIEEINDTLDAEGCGFDDGTDGHHNFRDLAEYRAYLAEFKKHFAN